MASRESKGGGTAKDMTFMARLISGAKFIVTGQDPDFGPITNTATNPADATAAPFGPMQPLQPVFQEGMKGRQLDYRPGQNITYVPRQEEPVTFAQLRGLADSYDLVRLAIETRKDQLCKLAFSVQNADKTVKDDPRAKKVQDFLRFPDKERNWQTWLRAVVEELLVIDAPTIYPRSTRGGELYSLDLMDGALVKRVIDGTGRTPAAPSVAYQAVIKGVPAVSYFRMDIDRPKIFSVPTDDGQSIDGLIYMPRNQRTNRFYGMSPVEQIIITINIAMRRQLSLLEFFTDGSLPNLLIACPKEWNPDQIQYAETAFNSLLSGNTAARRQAKFIPGGQEPYNIKDPILKDELDEWFARIVCYAFSLPPTAFVKQMNRASADNQKEQALEEGLFPLMEWVKGLMDYTIITCFGFSDLEFVWQDVKEIDPLVQAQIDDIYLKAYVIGPEEVRVRQGLEGPAPEKPVMPTMGAKNDDDPGGPGSPGPDGSGGKRVPGDKKPVAKEKDETERIERVKKKARILPIDRDRDAMKKAVSSLEKIFNDFFAVAGPDIADQVVAGLEKVGRADAETDVVNEVLDGLAFTSWSAVIPDVEAALEQVAVNGGAEALTQIEFAATENITKLLNVRSLEYAEQRAADLVGMRNIGTKAAPEWIVNPRAEFAITESTRGMLRTTVAEAVENGWSHQKLKKAIIEDNPAFSSSRATTIARTETTMADMAGNMAGYRASGVVTGKEWLLGSNHVDEDECDRNARQGVIPLDDLFQSGDDAPILHPRCVCSVIPVTALSAEWGL